MNISLYEIADIVEGSVIHDSLAPISTLSPIESILPGSLVFADGLANFEKAKKSDCAAILTHPDFTDTNKGLIHVPHPLKAFIALLHYFYPVSKPQSGIHPTAVIAADVVLGEQVSIGPFVVIESGAVIGDHCCLKGHVYIGESVSIGAETTLHPHVTIYANCVLGKRVSIHASTVIGSDGFGYTFIDGKHVKIPHVGQVHIGDDVEIGANTVIDRGTLGATAVGKGSKIDNLVQIAHSVKLGEHNILCAFTGVAGSTCSGNHVIFAANVGVSDHVQIDDGVILAARAGVPPKKHLLKGNVYLGNPARPKKKALEQELALTRIPYMQSKFKDLSTQIHSLEGRLKDIEESVS